VITVQKEHLATLQKEHEMRSVVAKFDSLDAGFPNRTQHPQLFIGF
jgi:hypothetical protein